MVPARTLTSVMLSLLVGALLAGCARGPAGPTPEEAAAHWVENHPDKVKEWTK